MYMCMHMHMYMYMHMQVVHAHAYEHAKVRLTCLQVRRASRQKHLWCALVCSDGLRRWHAARLAGARCQASLGRWGALGLGAAVLSVARWRTLARPAGGDSSPTFRAAASHVASGFRMLTLCTAPVPRRTRRGSLLCPERAGGGKPLNKLVVISLHIQRLWASAS